MANFDFLKTKTEYSAFAAAAIEAERVYKTFPAMCAVGCRKALELAVKWVYAADNTMEMPYRDNLQSLIHEPSFKEALPYDTWKKFPFLIKLGNLSVHTNHSVTASNAIMALRVLFEFVEWIDYCYGADYTERHFDERKIPAEKVVIDEKKIKERDSLLKENEKEKERLYAKIRELSAQLTAEKEKNRQNRTFMPDDPTEYETRKNYIDINLGFVGWVLSGPSKNVWEEYPVENMGGVPGKNGFVYGDRFRAGTDRHGPWLAFMEQRLKAAKPLLSERGVLFISIDDNEQARLKILCDGIFGEENCAGTMIHQRAKGGGQAKHLVRGHDYILVYAADLSRADLSRRKVVQKKTVLVNGERCVKNDDFLRKSFGKYGKDSDRRCFYEEIETYKGAAKKREVDAKLAAGEYFLEQAEQDGGLHRVCRYENLSQSRSKLYSIVKILSEEGKKDLEALGITGFEYPKPVELVKFLVDAASKKDSLVLDFFAGSGTTGQAVMRLNREDGGRRRFILCTSGENGICRNITRKRLARAAQAEGGGTGTTRFFTLEPAQS